MLLRALLPRQTTRLSPAAMQQNYAKKLLRQNSGMTKQWYVIYRTLRKRWMLPEDVQLDLRDHLEGGRLEDILRTDTSDVVER